MRIIFISIAMYLLIFSNVALSQTAEQTREEAFPEQKVLADNSPYAVLWKQVIEARKSGNEILYNELTTRLMNKYPGRFRKPGTPANVLRAGMEGTVPPFVPTDWINGDILVYAGGISAPTNGNPNPNDRMIKVESDSTGNQYAAFVNGTRDTMYLYKSTNNGTNWGLIQFVIISGAWFHSFDMFITDSLSNFRLGFAVSVVSSTSSYDGQLFWASVRGDGSGFIYQAIQATPSGRGLIAPAIVSDGYLFPASQTFWYVAYQNVDASTGVGNLALLALSTDWGASWLVDTARSSYNDYELDVDYAWDGDTIYVHLTNNLTASNENLRLRYSAVSNIGTGVTWKQFNTAGTSSPEKAGCLTASRNSNEIIVTYTVVQSGDNNIAYTYTTNGYTWTTGVPLASGSQSETRSKIECQQRQGVYHVSFVSTASGYDTVVYMKSTNIGSGFGDRQVVNVTNNSSSGLAPDVVGFRVSNTANGSGVGFAGAGNSGLFYDGSEVIVGIRPGSPGVPSKFSLSQNYPNPFNPKSKIKYQIAKLGNVKLVVYDVLGKEVVTLVNEQLKPGTYEVEWDGTNYPSGVYFYRLTNGETSIEKKMVLVK